MGFLSNIGEKFSNTIWGSVDTMMNSMAESANSFVYSGGAILNTGVSQGNSMGQFNDLASDTYFDFLKNYHFVSSLLDILCSCLNDAINKSDFHVTITGDEEHTNRANKLIDEIQLKKFILDNLRDIIYHGVYAFGIDYKNKKLYSLTDPYSCKIITNTRDVIGYEINGKLYNNDNIVCYYHHLRYMESIGDNVNIQSNPYSIIGNKQQKKTETKSTIPESLQDLVVKFKKYDVEGLFNSKLFRVFQMYSLEVALYYLGMRESMKPTLLGMSTGGKQINLINAIDMCNQVEELLNQPTTGLAQMSNPTVYMNQLIHVMLNNVRVVPSIDQYNSISEVTNADIAGKRDKLSQELDNIKKEILNELTIPEELFGGSGNRWEQYSRSDKFMTTIDNMLSSISNLVKQIVCKYTGISTVSISFNIDTTALSASYDTKNKMDMLSEKLANISKVISSFKDIVENEYCIPALAYEYLFHQCSAIDEKVGAILVKNLAQMSEDAESSEGDGDDFGGDDGGDFDFG